MQIRSRRADSLHSNETASLRIMDPLALRPPPRTSGLNANNAALPFYNSAVGWMNLCNQESTQVKAEIHVVRTVKLV